MTETLDLNGQGEWFDDVQGTRTGNMDNYIMGVVGVNYHPCKYVEVRPEVRYDAACDRPAFAPNANNRNQLTAAVDVLLKF